MEILATIPHFHSPGTRGEHGSLRDDFARVAAVKTCILGLHRQFGAGLQGLSDGAIQSVRTANSGSPTNVTIIVCTSGPRNLLDEIPNGLFHRLDTNAPPERLGFACHDVLRKGIGTFDYFCYLEDDLLITDPLFFDKLIWFTRLAGESATLQPNRFELDPRQVSGRKLYVDGDHFHAGLGATQQDRAATPAIEAMVMGRSVRFIRPRNVHSGCFFLNAAQMRRWADSPAFEDRSDGYWGPLESAANLGIMRFFNIYKPHVRNAGFLEVQHLVPRYFTEAPDNGYINDWLNGGTAENKHAPVRAE